MESMWIGIAAACAALASWLYCKPVVAIGRLRNAMNGDSDYPTIPDDALQPMLILRLLRVAVAQGSSIPAACEAVGNAVGGEIGAALEQVGLRLQQGVRWADAWRIAECNRGNTAQSENDFHVNEQIRANANTRTDSKNVDSYLTMIRLALEPSWMHGDAPGVRLEATLEQMDSDERSVIERNAAKLSVKLLLPTGLCFLPAFIAIGVIPSIVSFVM
ncbi:tadc [Bifidobacterium saguini DSM 23967]|uniref:Tadc n=4 Tax=Bifidobacterium TaxID=1678 RepID=A0A2N5ITY3_9BIFI|nr:MULTISPECIES: type II secretion system F family protein [Bifidobacterium]KFI92865.1 tadc [Bifidobacterium saguini DSM 23967]PLS25401.1 tadc [Bifidobacterium imperatoris]QSY58787.1 type II secretion system F family protein [Bifidobacterium imperatoris]QTB92001.1 type II secretion system F family protein [Bifidobacterium saguini]